MTTTMDLADAVTLHQLSLQAEGRSPHTLRLYMLYQRRFLAYLAERRIPPTLDALNVVNARAALQWVRENSGTASSRGGQVGVAAMAGTLKTWASFLENEGVFDASPLHKLHRVRVPKVLRQPFTDQEVMALWGAARQTRTPIRDEAIVLLLLDSGMRIGELCTLTLANLKLEERRIIVGLEGKGRRERIVPIGDATRVGGGRTMAALRACLKARAAILERYPDRMTDRVFLTRAGFALTPEGGTDAFRRIGKLAGVDNAIPHRARHSFATHYLTVFPGDEIGLRRIIGHASDDVTRDYVHLAQSTIAGRTAHASIVETMATPRADPRVQSRQRRSEPLQDSWRALREAPVIPPLPKVERQVIVQRARAGSALDRDALIEAVKTDKELRQALLHALLGAA